MEVMASRAKAINFPMALHKTTEVVPKPHLNFCHEFPVLETRDNHAGNTPSKQNECCNGRFVLSVLIRNFFSVLSYVGSKT